MCADSIKPPRRPAMPGPNAQVFEDLSEPESDPAVVYEVANRTAHLLVRGMRDPNTDQSALDRVRDLASTPGMDELAVLWGRSGPNTLPGALWRLYLLDSLVREDPAKAAREYVAGRAVADSAEVSRVIAGVEEPPGAREVQTMIDQVLRGIPVGEFDVVLARAAAFAHVVALGRSTDEVGNSTKAELQQASRLMQLAAELSHAASLERRGQLQ